jgi:hypothetical protein
VAIVRDAPAEDPDFVRRTPLIAVNALYVLDELRDHTKECTKRWLALFWAVIWGFGALTLAFLGLIFTILLHGLKP